MEMGIGDDPLAPSFEIVSPSALIRKMGTALKEWETRGKEVLNHDPLESLIVLVAAGAAVYWAAEKEKNEKVRSYWEALEYVATCASVGYSNIFPTSALGRMVASVLFVLGPSLAAKALDHPAAESLEGGAAIPAGQHAMLGRLDEILAELKGLNGRL